MHEANVGRLQWALVVPLVLGTVRAAGETIVMGAMGDSISRAFNAGSPLDQPERSWATGGDSRVTSHKKRLEALGKTVVGSNASRTGAKAFELPGQANKLVSDRVPGYVTVLIGANDVCGWDDNFSANLSNFERDIRTSFATLEGANGDVRILLVGIPDMLQMWEVGTENDCRATWDLTGLCSRLLGRTVTDLERQRFGQRLAAANDVLSAIAADDPEHVRFVARATTATFEWRHLSPIDCFHPSIAGQALLSQTAWEDGWFAGD